MTYETLLNDSEKLGLIVKEKPLKYNDGRIKGNRVAIRKDLETSKKKMCVLSEEIGHHLTASGDILDQTITENRKAENKGRILAYDMLIGLSGIISAYESNCKNSFEMAEHLNVTEIFLSDAIKYYKSKFGLFAKYENFIIYFEPLGVLKLI